MSNKAAVPTGSAAPWSAEAPRTAPRSAVLARTSRAGGRAGGGRPVAARRDAAAAAFPAVIVSKGRCGALVSWSRDRAAAGMGDVDIVRCAIG